MDFLIGCKPYHFEAACFRISVGASYTFWAFGTQTVRVQVDAGVDLWGPEFGDLATKDVGPFSFGASLLGRGADFTGPPFVDRLPHLLPAAAAPGCRHRRPDRRRLPGPEPGKNDLGSVNALEMVLVTDCVVPSWDATRGGTSRCPSETAPPRSASRRSACRSRRTSPPPTLAIAGFAERFGGEPLPVLRRETLSRNVLLCLFTGTVRRLEVRRRAEFAALRAGERR